jgi:hypothetical protein
VGTLPGLAFPFVRLFGADAHGCFELLATLLGSWAQGWWERFPEPPVALMRKMLVRWGGGGGGGGVGAGSADGDVA